MGDYIKKSDKENLRLLNWDLSNLYYYIDVLKNSQHHYTTKKWLYNWTYSFRMQQLDEIKEKIPEVYQHINEVKASIAEIKKRMQTAHEKADKPTQKYYNSSGYVEDDEINYNEYNMFDEYYNDNYNNETYNYVYEEDEVDDDEEKEGENDEEEEEQQWLEALPEQPDNSYKV